MFRKLGVKISRDALDWLSLDGSFITANVSFFLWWILRSSFSTNSQCNLDVSA